jgi:hypothetical protein
MLIPDKELKRDVFGIPVKYSYSLLAMIEDLHTYTTGALDILPGYALDAFNTIQARLINWTNPTGHTKDYDLQVAELARLVLKEYKDKRLADDLEWAEGHRDQLPWKK